MGEKWKQWKTIFLGSKITVDGGCSHEIKRRLLLGRKTMKNLDRILKSRDIILLTKVHLVKDMVFLVVIHECELDHKEGRAPKNWCFQTMVLKKTLENSLDSEEIKPINPKGNQSWIFIGRWWICWCQSWPSNTSATWCKELTHWKTPWCWERLKAGGEWGDRRWDCWMASTTQWTWVWANSWRQWRTGKPGVLQVHRVTEADTTEGLNKDGKTSTSPGAPDSMTRLTH